jgi:hypothetical protein
VVIHDEEDDRLLYDGVNDPNIDDAWILTPTGHVTSSPMTRHSRHSPACRRAAAAADADDDIDWTVSVDSTVVRAHQHAAGALEKGRPTPASPLITRSDARAAG